MFRTLRYIVRKILGKMPSLLPTGTPAPAFEVDAHDGSRMSLEGLRGKRVVLWFYPKADTPG